MASADELVEDISGLITLPDVYVRINQLIDDPGSTTRDIARAISQDASFTARLLRVANSALYGFPSSIETVDRAVTLIGTSQIRSLALSLSVASSFAGLPNDLVSMENFWKHSLLCALAARHLAKEARRCDPEALFTAGLLHDIGELILFNRLPEASQKALLMVLDSGDELPVHTAEQQVLGFDHSMVGGKLAANWNLPPLLQACIAHHHDPASAKQYAREAALVHLANCIALMAEVNTLDLADVEAIDPRSWQLTGLDETVIRPTLQAIQEEAGEVMKLFADKT